MRAPLNFLFSGGVSKRTISETENQNVMSFDILLEKLTGVHLISEIFHEKMCVRFEKIKQEAVKQYNNVNSLFSCL